MSLSLSKILFLHEILGFVVFFQCPCLSKFLAILQVVYMDEPSTGLDPASRSNLWNVVKRAKQDRAIILTSTTLSLPLMILI
jgi:ABC-type cobalamin transport system ATPase subunit